MTIEQLLIPRYELISSVPNLYGDGNLFIKGLIFELELDGKEEINVHGRIRDAAWFEKYPNIFRKMNWWENRKFSDFKCLQYMKYMSLTFSEYRYITVMRLEKKKKYGKIQLLANDYIEITDGHYFPVTSKEYNDFIKQSNK